METDMRVGDCMRKGVITLKATDSVMDAAKLMRKNRIGSVIVKKGANAAGIVTDGDITRKVVAAGKDPEKVKLNEVMSSPLKTIAPTATVVEAAGIMRSNGIKRLPVVSVDEKLTGIITDGHLLGALPGLVEVLYEEKELHEYDENVYFSGVCEQCGLHSDTLMDVQGKLLCEECREEEEL